ncbi:MAG: thioredoxin domain-containing protein [Candidatus Scalindua sediminis]|nr:thioredoxin domain-containing protein [Candidatus Scalindua sediminis]
MRSCLRFLLTAALIFGTLVISQSFNQECEAESARIDQEEIVKMAEEILAGRHCPCQCGRYLPGSSLSPACFGCSVGKAEITYVLESLEAGKKPTEIIMDLSSPVIIDVFADYTNENISKVWKLAKRVSSELHKIRVVLRTPGLTAEARRAIKLAECARLIGHCSVIQEALINHQGPWDWDTLINLTEHYGMDPERIRACVDGIDIDAQITKDQQHAEERGIRTYPTITINRQITANSEQAIRKAIQKVLLEQSI